MRLSLFVLTRQWVWRRRREMPWRCGPVSPGCLMGTPCKPISANACRSVERLPPMVGSLEQVSAEQHPVDPGDPTDASASKPARPRYLKLRRTFLQATDEHEEQDQSPRFTCPLPAQKRMPACNRPDRAMPV